MSRSRTWLMKVLEDEDLKLAIARGEYIIHRGRGEGIKPLIDAMDTIGLDNLKGAILADRIVGLAVSYLAVYAGFSEIHGLIVSRSAINFLESRGIAIYWMEAVDAILDRSKSSLCPFEKIALEVKDPRIFYLLVKNSIMGRSGGKIAANDLKSSVRF
ncbi:MAG: DUF1893 domain-containing protein [Nitrososphaerota archaeon]|nr:DUF1893 domain-containing protein [Candidatus Bathyarchaeota archaeon]MDW8061746.1 DUF1893 domain-containing protein [Nitrososphaerota archaeon]